MDPTAVSDEYVPGMLLGPPHIYIGSPFSEMCVVGAYARARVGGEEGLVRV